MDADLAIIGAGAAGLMAGIWAGRTQRSRRIVVLDGARKLGAKILVAGGGRCNVTHEQVDASAYAGGSRHAINKVLRRFDVPETIAFFEALGVPLKREETGKLFPTTDDARTVLHALLNAARAAGVDVRHPCRVESIERLGEGFRIAGPWGNLTARRVILATGGCSLPKSGSDGQGYQLARALGHSLTARIFPALVPLLLPRDHPLCALSGVSATVTLHVQASSGRRLQSFTNALLCTHFGISGPAALDISRYWTAARFDDPSAALIVNWLPDQTTETIDAALRTPATRTPLSLLSGDLPERLIRTLCAMAGVDPAQRSDQLSRVRRRALAAHLTALKLPVTGDRGFTYAEVTAGGIPLTEINLLTMESRVCPGLFLCGEICNVDGRIGGFNFQWAWSSGYVAGISA
jgi:predicted Rossmann fold flavoprotein